MTGEHRVVERNVEMIRFVLLSLLLAVPLLVAAEPKKPDPKADAKADAKADEKKMQGTWAVVSVDSLETPPEGYKKAKFVFDKDTVKVIGGPKKTAPEKFKLAIKKGQGEIDIQPPRDVKPVLGLYKFEKDQLTLAFARPGEDRPNKFGNYDAITIVLKKDKK
jgi:uncharacterized protein (TIGR03067 family)